MSSCLSVSSMQSFSVRVAGLLGPGARLQVTPHLPLHLLVNVPSSNILRLWLILYIARVNLPQHNVTLMHFRDQSFWAFLQLGHLISILMSAKLPSVCSIPCLITDD